MNKKNLFITAIALVALITVIFALSLPIFAAQPAMQMGSGTVLFSSAPGVKNTGVGSLASIGTYNGSEAYVNTVLDASRAFRVNDTSASTVIGGTLRFTYTGASIGADEYVSAIITDTTGKILYYGKLKNTSDAADASSIVSMTVPHLLGETVYRLYLFSEKCSASGDTASAFSVVSLMVYPDPYITTTTLPATTQGVNYKNVFLQAESSSPNLTWSVQAGSLPQGMHLNSTTGELTGAPTIEGTYNFTVKAEAGGIYHTRAFTLVVNPSIEIEFSTDIGNGTTTNISVPRGRTVTLTASISHGTPPYSHHQWSVNGVKITGATNLSYKLPTNTVGSYIYTFATSDLSTANASASITVEVRDPIVPTVTGNNLSYDKANPSVISFTKNDGDYPFESIKVANVVLIKDTHYTVNNNTITISKDFLDRLTLGINEFVLDYGDTTADPKVTVTVIDSSAPPVVAALDTPAAINRGQKLSIQAPTVTTYGAPITAQGWKIRLSGATAFTDFNITSTLECNYNKATLYYYATNAAGTTVSNEVTVTVNHTPSAVWNKNKTEHWKVCDCGQKFDLAPHTSNNADDCTICGYHCDHVYSAFKSDNNATCTTDATKSRTCTLCGHTESVIDPNTKYDHIWSSTWQVSETEHWKVCTRCSTISNKSAHVPGAPATTSDPQTCTVCDKILKDKLSSDSSAETTIPGGNTPVTTVPGGNTPTTTAPGSTPADTTTSGFVVPDVPLEPNDTSSAPDITVSGNAETTAPATPPKPTINIDRKPGDTNDNTPTFVTQSDLSSIIIITVDKRPLTKDEYTVNITPNGSEITIHPITPISSGNHTLSIETEDGKGSANFEIKGDGSDGNGSFPFWLLWVIPHILADILGLVLIIILLTKKKDGDSKATSDESIGNNPEQNQ